MHWWRTNALTTGLEQPHAMLLKHKYLRKITENDALLLLLARTNSLIFSEFYYIFLDKVQSCNFVR